MLDWFAVTCENDLDAWVSDRDRPPGITMQKAISSDSSYPSPAVAQTMFVVDIEFTVLELKRGEFSNVRDARSELALKHMSAEENDDDAKPEVAIDHPAQYQENQSDNEGRVVHHIQYTDAKGDRRELALEVLFDLIDRQ